MHRLVCQQRIDGPKVDPPEPRGSLVEAALVHYYRLLCVEGTNTMREERDEDTGHGGDLRRFYYERREYERRERIDRRGPLRWDPLAKEKQRRAVSERRRLN